MDVLSSAPDRLGRSLGKRSRRTKFDDKNFNGFLLSITFLGVFRHCISPTYLETMEESVQVQRAWQRQDDEVQGSVSKSTEDVWITQTTHGCTRRQSTNDLRPATLTSIGGFSLESSLATLMTIYRNQSRVDDVRE